MTDPPPARRTFVYSSHRFLSKLCLYAHIAYVRVSSLSSVEVLRCVAPMEDSRGDPSQEDTIDPDALSLQHTTRLPAGRGDSSQFTTQGAPHGAQNQRPAVSASDLGLDPRLMLPVNTPLLSQNEPTSSGGRRGVNTDGGSHPADSLGTPNDNPRPQPSAGTIGRSSGSSAAAFVRRCPGACLRKPPSVRGPAQGNRARPP